MATIVLYANKINQMPSLIKDIKQSVTDYKSGLFALKTKALAINKSVCNLDDIISSIQASTQTQEQKIDSLDTFSQNSEQFISDAVRIDGNVADIVKQRKDNFYNQYSYLKPECEKNDWEKIKDGCKKASEWVKDNWKSIGKILLTAVTIAALGIATALTGGILGVILAGAFWGALSGALIGGIIGGIASVMNDGAFLDGFADGALSGAVTGAITGAAFAGIGVLGAAFGKTLQCGTQLANLVKVTSKVTRVISLGMSGFDLLAMSAGFVWGNDNPFTAFNAELHSSVLYNGFQIGVSALAIFTGVADTTAACFIAGTMILTATGLVAIENIKAGDKVISTNENTFETAEKTVVETYIREVPRLVHLTINSERISTTIDHPFYVKNRGFINAGDLRVGDEVINSSSETYSIENIYIEIVESPVTVYNFQVEDFHTYHVGDVSVLVHNADKYDTGWSDEITDNLKSQEEADIYKKAGLEESEVGGKKALVRDDIDFSSPENIARLNGDPPRSPVNNNGDIIELHHIGQKSDSPLAQLTAAEHRSAGNNSILHDTSGGYQSKIDRNAFAQEKRTFWELFKNEN